MTAPTHSIAPYSSKVVVVGGPAWRLPKTARAVRRADRVMPILAARDNGADLPVWRGIDVFGAVRTTVGATAHAQGGRS